MLGYGVGVGEYLYFGILVGGGIGARPLDKGPGTSGSSNFKAGFLKDVSMGFFGTNNLGKSGGEGAAGYLTGGYLILASISLTIGSAAGISP